MKKSDISAAFRKYVKDHLSPTANERSFVTSVYEALQAVLGTNNCLQIGSYPRFTANTPLHDLDVLYVIGPWPGSIPNPVAHLDALKQRIEKEFINPTELVVNVSLQTHSITIAFLDGTDEFFAIDVVPAYTSDTNEFGDDMYMVPEILRRRRAKRRAFYEELVRAQHSMGWIRSDPRGYIEVAKRVNESNNDFRKAAKFVKGWKCACKELDDKFTLKSFHVEQVITSYFREHPQIEIYDAVLRFFQDLLQLIAHSQIPDRADDSKNIDDYVDSLTETEKRLIIEAREAFLFKLEHFSEGSDVKDLIEAGFSKGPKQQSPLGVPSIRTTSAQASASGFVPRSPWASGHDVRRK